MAYFSSEAETRRRKTNAIGDVSFPDERNASREERNYFPERIFDVDTLARIFEKPGGDESAEQEREKGWERAQRDKKGQRIGRSCGIIPVLKYDYPGFAR